MNRPIAAAAAQPPGGAAVAGDSGLEGRREPLTRLETLLHQRVAAGRKLLIPYLCAGDPDLETTAELASTLAEAGADALELGVPFSDPLADGPVIQAAAQRSLAAGTTVRGVLQLAARLRARMETPLVLMTYYNPVLNFGLQEFAAQAAACGVDGLIVPDLPLEEAAALRSALGGRLALVPLMAPTSPLRRLEAIGAAAQGFVYCVSVTGVTGVRDELPPDVEQFLRRVRRVTDLPLCVGFGVSRPEQARRLAACADGVIVGSALVKAADSAATAADRRAAVRDLALSLRAALDNWGP